MKGQVKCNRLINSGTCGKLNDRREICVLYILNEKFKLKQVQLKTCTRENVYTDGTDPCFSIKCFTRNSACNTEGQKWRRRQWAN